MVYSTLFTHPRVTIFLRQFDLLATKRIALTLPLGCPHYPRDAWQRLANVQAATVLDFTELTDTKL